MTTPPPSRRVLVGGALAATAAAVTTTGAPAYAAGGKHDGPPLLSGPDRHLVTRFSYGLTPDARARRTQGGRCDGVVRAAAPPAQRRRQGRSQGRCLVARAVLLARQAVAAADQRGPGRLAGDGQLPATGPAATDPDQPPGAGDDDRVLGEPPQRPGQRRRAVHLPGVVRRPHPRARAGQVLRPAGRGDHPPGDADLPRPGDLHQAAPEREPRPRAARVPHRRPWQLHRGPRQGVGAHPHRLHGRHVGDLAGALQPRGALARAPSR